MATDLPNHHRLALIGIERAFTERRKAGLGQVNEDLQSTVDAAMGWICDLERERDEARAELTAIRAALGNGADEAAWPPGLTLAEAVGRLREAWRKAEPAPLCDQCVSVREEAGWVVARHCTLPAGHEGPHAEALGDNGGPNG